MDTCHLSLVDEAVHTRGKVSDRVVWVREGNLRWKSAFLPAHHSSRTGHLEPGLHLLSHRPGEWHATDGLRPRCPEWSLRGFQEKFRPPPALHQSVLHTDFPCHLCSRAVVLSLPSAETFNTVPHMVVTPTIK